MHHLEARAREPGVPATEPDEALMLAVERPPVGREVAGSCGERRADRVVTADALLLDAAEALLVARIHRRRPGHEEQHRERMRDVARVRHGAAEPRDVVVADKRVREERGGEGVVPLERPRELEEVEVDDRAPERLPELVLRDGVDPRIRDVLGVVAVDHLAEHPRLGVRGANAQQDALPERRRDRVDRVEPPAVGPPAEPVGHHVGDRSATSGLSWLSATSAPWPSNTSGSGTPSMPVRQRTQPPAAESGPSASAWTTRGWSRPTWLNTPSSTSRTPRSCAGAAKAAESPASPRRGSIRRWSIVSYPWLAEANTGPRTTPLHPSSTA